MSLLDSLPVVARNSPLSRAQVQEVLEEIRKFYPELHFFPTFVETTGDLDLKTSLRTLPQTDFFTKEVDLLVCGGLCRIAIHSAKDLPFSLPTGLKVVAITAGVDKRDALVLRDGETLNTLPYGAKIATSSLRREDAVRKLREDLSFIDIRGKIEDRLEKLKTGEADGIVIAEAALIRLGLTHLNRLYLPGETAPGQGQLAIVAREEDQEMTDAFAAIDVR